jgi:hypothetical protein
MESVWVNQTGRVVSKTFSAGEDEGYYRASILDFVVDDVMKREGIVDISGGVRSKETRLEGNKVIPVGLEIDWGVSSCLQAGFVRTRACDLDEGAHRNYRMKEITIYGSRKAIKEFEERLKAKDKSYPRDQPI